MCFSKKRSTILRNPFIKTASFSYVQTTKTNNIKFGHQSLCNPPNASLLKAINAGFLDWCPTPEHTHGAKKYRMASPASTKGHMKQPCKRIRSTTPKPTKLIRHSHVHLTSPMVNNENHVRPHKHRGWGKLPVHQPPNLMQENEDISITKIFCYHLFAAWFWALCTMTAWATPSTCCSTATSVFLSCTTRKPMLSGYLTAACKAFSLANGKEMGTNDWIIRSLD